MSTRALIEALEAEGMEPEAIIRVLKGAEKKRDNTAAERQARYRERRKEAKDNARNSNGVTPPKEYIKPPSSVSNETGSADPVKEVFELGVAVLTASGLPDRQARSLIGKYRKDKSDAEVLAALLDCRRLAISNPVEWLEKRFKGAKWVSKSGYEYRGTDEQVLREAERRGDNDTYWRVKGSMKKAAA